MQCDTPRTVTGKQLHPADQGYDPFMKNTQLFALFLGSILLGSILLGPILLATSMLAQTTNPASLPESGTVALARIRYLQAANRSSPVNDAENQAGENETLAQFSRRPPGPPMRRAMRPPMGGHPRMSGPNWGSHGAIGALIGFSVGAGAGAAWGATREPAANRAGDALLGGLLLGGLGAAMGAAIASLPPFPSRQFHRHRPWEDEDYDELGSRFKPRPAQREASPHLVRNQPPARQQAGLAAIQIAP
jgi:hypothetical protein